MRRGYDEGDRALYASLLADDFFATTFDPIIQEAVTDGPRTKHDYVDIIFADDLVGSMMTTTVALIAMRGDDYCLLRSRISAESGDLTERLMIAEHRGGRIAGLLHFAHDQLTEALLELDRRWLRSIGFADDHLLFRIMPAAYSLDPADMALVLHPDLEYVEHRALTFEGGDSARLLANMATISVDTYVVIPAVHRISERGAVWEKREVAASDVGETAFIIVARFEDGLCRVLETFEADDLDAALARYDELNPPL